MRRQLLHSFGLLLVLSALTVCAQELPKKVFVLFPVDKKCICVKPIEKIERLTWNERRVGREIFQVFYDRKTGQETFRFGVGTTIDNEWVKWWLYGIAARGDFNGDGVEDYSWEGGDDTSSSLYILLSSPHGYLKIDVLATLAEAWRRRLKKVAPDFHLAGGPYSPSGERIERVMDVVTLVVNVTNVTVQRSRALQFRVDEKDFVIAKD